MGVEGPGCQLPFELSGQVFPRKSQLHRLLPLAPHCSVPSSSLTHYEPSPLLYLCQPLPSALGSWQKRADFLSANQQRPCSTCDNGRLHFGCGPALPSSPWWSLRLHLWELQFSSHSTSASPVALTGPENQGISWASKLAGHL